MIGDQLDLRSPRRDVGDPPDEPVAVDHRVIALDAGTRSLVDRHVGEPDGRRSLDHPRRDELVLAQAGVVVGKAEQLAELLVVTLGAGSIGSLPDRILAAIREAGGGTAKAPADAGEDT